ncbi:type II secretion system protein [Vibrio harveyi]|uniref:type II secretion system protein n=1 Tax=Vibrio harveyi TaxID=669 RepID=UPI0002C47BEA|nr:type II secretion system protein [Vibrio harveyi]EMR36170.1 MSHA pilin protein MshA [Vibrio harveyi CAIM 1792]
MKRKSGFTLIELVVVIVILGILAVTAAPRFLNIQDDAREARLEGMKGAIASALNIGYGKMAIAGLEGLSYVSNDTDYKNHDESMLVPMQGLPFDGCEKSSSTHCAFEYGYPQADTTSLTVLVQELGSHVESTDWMIRMLPNRTAYITARDDKSANENKCSIIYAPPENAKAKYTLKINKCS